MPLDQLPDPGAGSPAGGNNSPGGGGGSSSDGPPAGGNNPNQGGPSGGPPSGNYGGALPIQGNVLQPGWGKEWFNQDKGGGGGGTGVTGDEALRVCGGPGGVPTVHGVSEAERYNYVDGFFSPYQRQFVKKKMREAHDAFVQHVANRQNYGHIMLMRYVRPDEGGGGDDGNAYNANAARNQAAVTQERNETWQALEAAEPDYHDLIWKHYEQLSPTERKKLDCSTGDKDVDSLLRGMIGKLFEVDAFKGDDPKAFWIKLCEWWVKYNGTRKYMIGAYSKTSDFGRLRQALLDWFVDKRSSAIEQRRDGRMLKSFWCFMALAVRRLRKKLPWDALAAGPDPVSKALLDFTRSTRGQKNEGLREEVADTAWLGGRLLQNLQSSADGTWITWKGVMLELKKALEALEKVLRRDAQEVRATADELNEVHAALQDAMRRAREVWMANGNHLVDGMPTDPPNTVVGITNQLAYARFLMRYTDIGNKEETVFERLEVFVNNAEQALKASTPPTEEELLEHFHNLQTTIASVYPLTHFSNYSNQAELMQRAIEDYAQQKAEVEAQAKVNQIQRENAKMEQKKERLIVAAQAAAQAAAEAARVAKQAQVDAQAAAIKEQTRAKKAQEKIEKQTATAERKRLQAEEKQEKAEVAAAKGFLEDLARDSWIENGTRAKEAEERNKEMETLLAQLEVGKVEEAAAQAALAAVAAAVQKLDDQSMDGTAAGDAVAKSRKEVEKRQAQKEAQTKLKAAQEEFKETQAKQAAKAKEAADFKAAKERKDKKDEATNAFVRTQENGPDKENERRWSNIVKAAREAWDDAEKVKAKAIESGTKNLLIYNIKDNIKRLDGMREGKIKYENNPGRISASLAELKEWTAQLRAEVLRLTQLIEAEKARLAQERAAAAKARKEKKDQNKK